MKIWATTFVVLFGLVELYQWVQHFSWTITLPLPVFILGGAALAIASNYDKRAGLPFGLNLEEPKAIVNSTANAINTASIEKPVPLNAVQSPEPQLPQFQPSASRSISFTIQNKKSQQ